MERVASHYVSPHVLERLMEDPDGLSLGGEAHEVTVLFADMRGFTTLSAVLRRQPGRLAEVINGILSPLTEIVVAHGGTIDKYMGDCVMAFWGAPVDDPRHAANALAAARAMLAAMPAINRELAEAHPDLDLPTIQIGVGVNTGECVVGNVGSRRRFDYSVLGDPVNVASRLQTLCKTYEHPLLIGEETARHVAADVAVVEIDQVAFGGSDEAQGVYAVL
jgi:adenylate cyclase